MNFHWREIAKPIYYKLFRLSLYVRFWIADQFTTPHVEPPLPPAILRYRVSETIAPSEFLRIGEGSAVLIRQNANSMNVDLTKPLRILDFGCGCGRTARWFLGGTSNAELHGVDVDVAAIEWCQKYLGTGRFLATSPDPPLPYAADLFDVVYCFSVFTHLNEDMQDLWLAELLRISKPGGLLILTIYGATVASGLGIETQRELDYRGLVHRRSRKLSGIVPDWYHTTLHSRNYIIDRLKAAGCGDVRYREVPDGLQDVVMARKLEKSFG